jgi:hypothetical protein
VRYVTGETCEVNDTLQMNRVKETNEMEETIVKETITIVIESDSRNEVTQIFYYFWTGLRHFIIY